MPNLMCAQNEIQDREEPFFEIFYTLIRNSNHSHSTDLLSMMDAPLHSQLTLRAMCATSSNPRSIVVSSNRICLFGRAGCDVILDSASTPGLTSRLHAQISFVRGENNAGPGTFVLRDMKSTNGTFHNEIRITEEVLSGGDRVIFGVKGGNKIAIGVPPLLVFIASVRVYPISQSKLSYYPSAFFKNRSVWKTFRSRVCLSCRIDRDGAIAIGCLDHKY